MQDRITHVVPVIKSFIVEDKESNRDTMAFTMGEAVEGHDARDLRGHRRRLNHRKKIVIARIDAPGEKDLRCPGNSPSLLKPVPRWY